MKKLNICIITFTVLFLSLISSCGVDKKIYYNEFYSGVIGFSDKDDLYKSIPKDEVLMFENEDYKKFKDEYFTKREIPIKTPDESKAVLYIQIPSKSLLVDTYIVKSITGNKKNIIIELNKGGSSNVDPIQGFDGIFKYVMFIELDRNALDKDTEIVVKS